MMHLPAPVICLKHGSMQRQAASILPWAPALVTHARSGGLVSGLGLPLDAWWCQWHVGYSGSCWQLMATCSRYTHPPASIS